MMALTAKSLILDLLSTVGRRSVPVRALVRAAAVFEIEANAVRVALARLRASALVSSDERGFYRLGSGARAVMTQVRSWRELETRLGPWAGGWIGVHTGALPKGDRRARLSSQRALGFLGFRTLEPGLAIRPDNVRLDDGDPVAAVRGRLHDLGLAPAAAVFALAGLDPARDTRGRGLWDCDGLRATYRATAERLRASAARLPELGREAAMVESFRLGGEGIRQLVFDPLLPDALVPASERRGLIDAMKSYERLGRACWAGALELESDPSHPAPAALGGWPDFVAEGRPT